MLYHRFRLYIQDRVFLGNKIYSIKLRALYVLKWKKKLYVKVYLYLS